MMKKKENLRQGNKNSMFYRKSVCQSHNEQEICLNQRLTQDACNINLIQPKFLVMNLINKGMNIKIVYS